ncbi:MAG: hypothetical protein NC308_07825 [Clostridium sp.]|nr:hypothetical protein [Bacteroides sp.]MCM1198783.1 hypothetical protein [Clostridium sp.]
MSSAGVDEKTLAEKYSKAMENTLLERVRGNNIDDIIEYRSALIESVRVRCENLLYSGISDFYVCLSEEPVILQLKRHFECLHVYAAELQQSLPAFELDDSLDREYSHIVPTDFYCRNVEDITPERAFQMVLLQFLARNESWMMENGLLVDGELKVYIGMDRKNMERMICKFEDELGRNKFI